jgi:hypothetical protein
MSLKPQGIYYDTIIIIITTTTTTGNNNKGARHKIIQNGNKSFSFPFLNSCQKSDFSTFPRSKESLHNKTHGRKRGGHNLNKKKTGWKYISIGFQRLQSINQSNGLMT